MARSFSCCLAFLLAFLGPRTSGLSAHPGGPTFTANGEGGIFIRGDADQNGQVELNDAIFSLEYLFLGLHDPYCIDALDADDDGDPSVTDAITVLGFLFLGNTELPGPYPAAGVDLSADDLNCDNGLFAHIRREIFATSCASTSCHSSLAAKGGLVLEGPRAYSELIQVAPSTTSARDAGLLLVKPGYPDESFLLRKLTGDLSASDGDRMPQVGRPLGNEQIDLIRHWIEDGAVPSTPQDIMLPLPAKGEQILIPPFAVKVGEEVQRNYYFKLKSAEDFWVNRIEFLYPPGSHHLNFFTGAPQPYADGYFEDNFVVVPFQDWSLRASSQVGRLDWTLPPGAGVKFKAHEQTLAQIHFVNIGSQISPIGGCAAINLHAMETGVPPVPLGALFLQNKSIRIPPNTPEISFDYGVTFSHYGHNVPVKAAAVTGHFHWRGKTFEIRRWDGQNQNFDGSPALPAPGGPAEFDRMGPENTIFFSDNWDEPPFNLFGADGPEFPPGWGIVYRTTYVNETDQKFCFGPHVATQEHANAFLYFYPGPADTDFLWFPPDCIGQGCTVPCR
ncbi:MAG: hypothetical protein HY717_04055 [Planctomycetes bacterium]|nr:hypothetical protein [Planctomycetota bacterium]